MKMVYLGMEEVRQNDLSEQIKQFTESVNTMTVEFDNFHTVVRNFWKSEIESQCKALFINYIELFVKYCNASSLTRWYYKKKMRKTKLDVLRFERGLPFMMEMVDNKDK